jgi:hypothetical protein
MQQYQTNTSEQKNWPKKYQVQSNFTKISLVNSMLLNISTAQVALGHGFQEQAAVYIKKSLVYLNELEKHEEAGAWLPISKGGRSNLVVNEFFKKSETAQINLLQPESKETNTYVKPLLVKYCLEKSVKALCEMRLDISLYFLEEIQYCVFVEAKDFQLPIQKLRDKLILARDFIKVKNRRNVLSALAQARIYFELNETAYSKKIINTEKLQEIFAEFEIIQIVLKNNFENELEYSEKKLNNLIEKLNTLEFVQ